MNTELTRIIDSICAVDKALEPQIQAHLDDLTHPKGSLGRLEEIAMRYCKIQRRLEPVLGRKIIFTFAADHGVAAEGVSAFPAEVTTQMVLNMLVGGAAVNVLASHSGAENRIVDMGVNYDFEDRPGLIDRKVRWGTDNLCKGPAMSLAEAEQALLVGAQLARDARDESATLLGTGEIGIANTTPSAALFAALLDLSAEEVTGRGSGINDERLRHKTQVVRRGLEANRSRLGTPIEVLAALGGFEIAGISGLCLGAASAGVPVVVDGFISSAAALVACRINPLVRDYLFFSHRSAESGHSTFLKTFDSRPILDLDLRLGEGTGAALAMHVIDASVKIYKEMATFSSAGVATKE
ncbi:MAG: nicotinate-nucleotide--dimethylbenzimidazole phosphoribosyltransferase [Verrucomicrobiota bacterium]